MGSARVVETLARTGSFSAEGSRRRLFETMQFVLQCTKSRESLQPGGTGRTSIRVRLLHAAVRMRILKLADTRPEYYSIQRWGIPINDMDSIGTITSFSASLIWISLPRQGIFLRQQEVVDFLALWRYVGYLVGCPTNFLATPAKAKAVMESLLLHEINPAHTSRILANNIIKSLEAHPPLCSSAGMLTASARWVNGDELADALGLAQPSPYYWVLMAGHCAFFCIICYTIRFIPYLDRKNIDALKKIFYTSVVDSNFGLEGKENLFEFKNVPGHSITTRLEQRDEARLTYLGTVRKSLGWLLFAAGIMVLLFVRR